VSKKAAKWCSPTREGSTLGDPPVAHRDYKCEVVAYCADLGQGEELIPVREKALRTGASAVHIKDLREEFVRDFIFPICGPARVRGRLPDGHLHRAAPHRQGQVEVARAAGADAVSHGANRQGQ